MQEVLKPVFMQVSRCCGAWCVFTAIRYFLFFFSGSFSLYALDLGDFRGMIRIKNVRRGGRGWQQESFIRKELENFGSFFIFGKRRRIIYNLPTE